jgi:uncharacterized protein YjeT (DUF2065 family)
MMDFVAALGLAFVIEGLLWSAFPSQGRAFLEVVLTLPEATVRRGGLVAMAIGVAIVWLVRG